MLVLGIESSCDETGIALYDTQKGLIANQLHTQMAMHAEYGGVVPELLPHLFEPFQTTHEAGTGLGLYVSRELAHANQGNLQYQPDTKTFELSMKRKKDE